MTWYVHFEFRGLKSTHRVVAKTAIFAGRLAAEAFGHLNNLHAWNAEEFITEIGKWVTLEEAARDNLGGTAPKPESIPPATELAG